MAPAPMPTLTQRMIVPEKYPSPVLEKNKELLSALIPVRRVATIGAATNIAVTKSVTM
ncbi:MAG: hypothetical protein DHS20C05_03990 [Hyphococcus sp.]|nr:MAG: hypothetical protein DHS20C05_03990 [Marinicaulis sp.]